MRFKKLAANQALRVMNDVSIKLLSPSEKEPRSCFAAPAFMTHGLSLICTLLALDSFLWHEGPMAKHPYRRFGFVALLLVHKNENSVALLKNQRAIGH